MRHDWHAFECGVAMAELPNLVTTFPDHLERHEQHDSDTGKGDPAVLVQDLGDQIGGHAHGGDGKQQAEYENFHMVLGGAGHGQHIIERHGDVGRQNLQGGGQKRLGLFG